MTSLKLLIVEDDPASLELMTEVFASLEAQVCPANNGQSASKLINSEKFDGIFLDLQVGDMHGFELAQRVRRSSWNKSTPIIIVTGYDDRHAMEQSFATGATFFLQKPVDRRKLTNLFRTVRGTLLENRRRYARIPLQTEVVCRMGARTVRGRTWNLSQGGMQIEVEDLKAGDKVQLSFELPATHVPIDASAEVVWVKEGRQGIHFTKMNPQEEEEIRNLIAQVETPE
jgi:CheY-like chemotaxis protein